MSLFWRIFLLNAVVLVVATALLLGPVTVSTPVLVTEAVILSAGLVVMLVLNALLLRWGLAPLQRLTRAMTTADLLRPGERPGVTGRREIAELISAFDAMLDRLQAALRDLFAYRHDRGMPPIDVAEMKRVVLAVANRLFGEGTAIDAHLISDWVISPGT